MISENKSIDKKAIQAGLWYTFCNVLIRGINFLTTPIFTRVMSKNDYGLFSNYASWLSILTIFTTLDLSSSIARAKLDYKGNLDEYITSIQTLGTFITIVFYIIACLFSSYLTTLFQLDMRCVHIMFIYLLVSPSFVLLQEKHKQLLKYKLVSALAIISTLSTMIISIVLVVAMEDKFFARVLGNTAIQLCICSVIYFYNIQKGGKVKLDDWKYALSISLPLVFHSLAASILGTSDRIVITNICGAEDNALYSVVYSCSLIVTLIGNSANQACVPWLYEKLENKKYYDVRRVMNGYVIISLVIVFCMMLVGPELVLLFGGREYIQSQEMIPCIMAGCYYNILYYLFVNIELYNKKTIRISIITIVAAIFNIITNLVFIPIIGYTAAAYTTLASYILMFILHFISANGLGASIYYMYSVIIASSVAVVFFMLLSLLVYSYTIARYIIITALGSCILYFLFKKRKIIMSFIRSK